MSIRTSLELLLLAVAAGVVALTALRLASFFAEWLR